MDENNCRQKVNLCLYKLTTEVESAENKPEPSPHVTDSPSKIASKEVPENGDLNSQSDHQVPEKITDKQKSVKTKVKKPGIISKEIVKDILHKVALLFIGYVICFFNWTILMLPLTVLSLVWYENQKNGIRSKISSKAKACSSTKEQLLAKIDELPSWVLFPDRERAEWINEIVLQLWPNINNYLIKFIKGSLQNKIKKKHESFRFEEVDFGNTPPKIDGVKVYNRSTTRDSILIDFDVFYDGDCDIQFSISGAQVGRLKDLQLSVEMRIVLKPLMFKAPIVGGVQIFFLNTPEIDFNLEGLSAIPGLSYLIRTKLEEKLRRKIVFPNKITKRFTKSVQATELKSLEPEGVIRIHIVEGKDLERRDVTGKSDPYAVFTVGAQEYKSTVIKRSLNPKWDEWCEFTIIDPVAQQVKFKLYDQDELNEDDFLGSGVVDIKSVYEGEIDQWISLDGVKHGKIHLRFTWLSLSDQYSCLEQALQEVRLLKANVSSALLTIYVDSAQNLPRGKSFKKPDTYLLMHVGNSELQQKSKIKKHTTDPIWEQGFSFVVGNPEVDDFNVSIVDKHSHTKIDCIEYNIKNLITEPNMEVSMNEFALRNSDPNSKLIMSLQLRILTNELFRDDENSTESLSEDDMSRQNSLKSNKSNVSTSPSHNFLEPTVESTNIMDITAPLASPLVRRLQNSSRTSSTESRGDSHLGRIHIGLQYSDRRQKLMVTIHKIINLPLKDPKDIPDPYVKLKLTSAVNTIRHKTKTIMDNCNPEFKETFEYLLSPSELADQRLVATIKTKKKLFTNNMLGQVVLYLKDINFIESHSKWYEIEPESVSD